MRTQIERIGAHLSALTSRFSRPTGRRVNGEPPPLSKILSLHRKSSPLFPQDVLDGTRLQQFNETLRKTDPLMGLNRRDLSERPEVMAQIVAESVAITETFSKELSRGMAEIKIRAKIKTSEKQPARILEKLSRKTAEKGMEYTLAHLGDLSRCCITVDNISDIYRLAAKIKQMYGDRILEWDDTLAHPRADGYTGRIHATILDKTGSRKMELQITTHDIIEFENEKFPVTEGHISNFHDLIYKGLGGKNPAIMREYRNILKEIVALNAHGKRLSSRPDLMKRIRDLRAAVIALYLSTSKNNWPAL